MDTLVSIVGLISMVMCCVKEESLKVRRYYFLSRVVLNFILVMVNYQVIKEFGMKSAVTKVNHKEVAEVFNDDDVCPEVKFALIESLPPLDAFRVGVIWAGLRVSEEVVA